MPNTVSPIARAKVQARVGAQMSDSVSVYRGQIGGLNPTTGVLGGLANPVTIYTGPARIHVLSGTGTIAVGGGVIAQAQAVISIPADAPLAQRDDVVVADAVGNIDDQTLQTRAFRVLEVSAETYFADARRLTCSIWVGSRWWENQQ